MSWCPRCKNEYPDDSATCWSCGAGLIPVDPAEDQARLDQIYARPAVWWGQILVVWAIALVAATASVLAFFGFGEWPYAALALAASIFLATIFYGGYVLAGQLASFWVCLAWLIAGTLPTAYMCFAGAMYDARGEATMLVLVTALALPGLGALTTISGSKLQQTKHWAYPLLPIAYVVVLLVWMAQERLL